MLVDLVRVVSSDGVRLDGALRLPDDAAAADDIALDALLLVHGAGASFYASSLLEAVAVRALKLGLAALVVNTRGHDILYMAATSQGPRLHGAARESVADCALDFQAWLDLLRKRGLTRIGLVGHSLGAIKGVYALAQSNPPDVAALVAISPARLSYKHFCEGGGAESFLETMRKARAHVDRGAGDTLMEVQFPIPYVVSAAAYVDKYGPAELYNIVPLVQGLKCPTLFVFGGQEVQDHLAFQGLPEDIASGADGRPGVSVATIAGGDHVYSAVRAEMLACLEDWLRNKL